MQNNPAPAAPIRNPTPPLDFHGGRVLIPRLERPPTPVPAEKRRRVANACTNCRKRKTKCTGGQPPCDECEVNSLPCVYEQQRKDRLKELSEQKQSLVAVLKDLRLSVNNSDRKRIRDVLEAVDEDLPHSGAVAPTTSVSASASASAYTPTPLLREGTSHPTISAKPPAQDAAPGASHPPTAVGLGSHDYAPPLEGASSLADETEDLDWLQNLQLELASIHEDSSPRKPSTDASLYMTNDEFDNDDTVDVTELPPLNTALSLYQNYTKTIHDWLPILPAAFEDQFRAYYDHPFQVQDKWLATLNLVFALGARFSRLTEGQGGNDDVVYFSRAIQLLRGIEKGSIASAPDLLLIQVLALLSLYYLTAGEADKAWTSIGISVRSALASGLHLQNNAPISTIQKETSTRTWWSLHFLECLTSRITGRPCTVPLGDCNISLPRTLPEEEARNNVVPLLRAQIQIGVIGHQALAALYSIQAAISPWDRIQQAATILLAELEKRSPDVISFSSTRQRLLLQFSILSTKLAITRPCLCPRPPQGHGHDGTPSTDTELANICIQTALELANLLPDEPDKRIYQDLPWWCLIHYLMQALAVILLDISQGGSQASRSSPQITALKRLFRWLHFMQNTEVVADRAVRVVTNALRNAHSLADISDLLEEETGTIYRHPPFVSGRWDAPMPPEFGPIFTPLLPEYEGQQLGQEIAPSLLSDPLPPLPLYGDPFLPNLDEPTSWGL